MSRYYHPSTLEHIPNPLPRVKEWAGEASTEAPAYDRNTETCHYVDGSWVVESAIDVAGATEDKIAELKNACRNAIFAGFDSDALGSTHRYPLSQTDQANLQKNETAAARNLDTDGWVCHCQCIDSNGVIAYREHTASQMLQVADDIQQAKDDLLAVKLSGLIADVRAIESDDSLTDDEKRTQIEAVSW